MYYFVKRYENEGFSCGFDMYGSEKYVMYCSYDANWLPRLYKYFLNAYNDALSIVWDLLTVGWTLKMQK